MDVESIHKADLLVRQANQVLSDAGVPITATQLSALSFIGSDGPRTLGEVAQALSVTPAVVTGLVDRLERGKFAIRTGAVGPDRRCTWVEITEAGRIVLDDAKQALIEAQEGQAAA